MLVKTDKPLEEAVKFLKPLQELSPNLIETQLLAFDIHFRRGIPPLFEKRVNCRKIFPGCGGTESGE